MVPNPICGYLLERYCIYASDCRTEICRSGSGIDRDESGICICSARWIRRIARGASAERDRWLRACVHSGDPGAGATDAKVGAVIDCACIFNNLVYYMY